MPGIYDCKIIAQSEIAPGVFRTLLTGPEIARAARPGQFVNVRVAGTLDPLLRRPFSVHAVYPEEGVFSLLYVLIGRGTKLLSKIPPYEKLSVVGPRGNPFDLGDSPESEHIVVAGGCGAAPLHFLCDSLCAKWGCERVTVLSGARNRDAVLCEAEFRAHGVEVGISTDDGSHGYHGLVTELLRSRLQVTGYRLQGEGTPSPPPGEGWGEEETPHSAIPIPQSAMIRVYSCGPHAMLREVARICREAGVASCQVSLERHMSCGIGVCTGCVQKIRGASPCDESGRDWHYERVCTEGPVFDAEAIVWE